MNPPIQFQDVQSIRIDVSGGKFALSMETFSVSIVPHFDRLVVTLDGVEQLIKLGDTQRLIDELAKGNSVEVSLHIGIPGQEEALELKVTWVGTQLAGGSKASTIKLLEETAYKISGSSPLRGLVAEEADTLLNALVTFADYHVREMVVSQFTHVSTTLGDKWLAKNWYGQ